MSTCPQCQGLIMEPGKAYGYAGPICTCHFAPQPKMPTWTPTGWLCPRCGAVHAPHVSHCGCTAEGAK